MTNLELAQDLYQMIGQGQSMDALDKYYAEDCTVVEGDGSVRKGREVQGEALKQWQTQMIKEMHDGGVGAITSNEDTGQVCVESWFEATFADGNRRKMEEVAVQQWKNGKIIHERFYYNVPNG